jgi:dienelactone hydrolase
MKGLRGLQSALGNTFSHAGAGMIGKTISHYHIVEELGQGGMGVVYKAEDTNLERTVALKFLPAAMTRDAGAKKRFIQEARAASALDHPNICTIHEVDETEDGTTFIVMGYYEGETLRERIERGPIDIEEALGIAAQIAEGLHEAHSQAIVHRDIKPANIMLTAKGQVKIMDFGLAKLRGQTIVTKEGTTLGTVAYMSPEQARGEGVDIHTDIWSLGVVLYEMVTGERPFKGDYEQAVIYSILNEKPKKASNIRKDISRNFENIILRALQKDPASRFESAREFLEAIVRITSPPDRAAGTGSLGFKRPGVFIPVLVVFCALMYLMFHVVRESGRERRARQDVLPQIMKLVEQEDNFAAYKLAMEVRDVLDSDPLFAEQWSEMTDPTTIISTPEGAEVSYKPYSEPEAEWIVIGETPIDTLDLPGGFFRWSIRKEGFQTIEAARSTWPDTLGVFVMDEDGSLPPGMIRVKAGRNEAFIGGLDYFHAVQLPDFLLDRFEVSNRQFMDFVDAGGYRRREFWKHEFIRDGRVLSWEEAMDLFCDKTGRAGPATWELGTYPGGEADYPVTGVSWYEAAAFAEFAGKSLPTIHHWVHASSVRRSAQIIPQSNFGEDGLASVGSHPGLGYFGEYDLAGNAREWCFTAMEGERYIMGGCWSDPLYSYNWPEKRSPFVRAPCNGFRCIKLLDDGEVPNDAWSDLPSQSMRDFSREKPVSDEVFAALLDVYHYDRKPLNARTEMADEEPEYWRIERISFDAAYGDERMFAYFFIPKGVSPPYQTVVLFPGSYALSRRSSGNGRTLNSFDFIDFVIRSGRAALYPVYKSTYERGDGFDLYDPEISDSDIKEHVVLWHKDLSRSVDYLETRADIDMEKLAFFGSSWGGWLAPIYLGLDRRYHTAVLRLCGLPPWTDVPPAFDGFNFISRITIPVLMLNTRYDYIFPHETSQVPMFEYLGTPPDDKRHVIFETAHTVYGYRNEMIREVLDWLDRYLGPVE